MPSSWFNRIVARILGVCRRLKRLPLLDATTSFGHHQQSARRRRLDVRNKFLPPCEDQQGLKAVVRKPCIRRKEYDGYADLPKSLNDGLRLEADILVTEYGFESMLSRCGKFCCRCLLEIADITQMPYVMPFISEQKIKGLR